MNERVLIIDDDKFVQSFLKKALSDTYVVEGVLSGEEGLVTAASSLPDAILLDVEMPGQNGYEVCDQLKRNELTKHIPVIFLSSKSSLRERMLGYEVGGDDYLVKPCSNEELNAKLKLLTDHSLERKTLHSNAAEAQSTAMEAMATSFELGKAVRFVERSYAVSDYRDLAEQLLDFCRELNLSAVVMIVTRNRHEYFSSTGNQVPPLESEVLDLLHGGKRFEDFGCRTQVNYPNVSVLVKNMPLDDRTRYGRIKDSLPFILGVADAKVRVLGAEKALTIQRAELSASVEAVKLTLTDMRESFGANLNAVTSIMSELIATLSMDLRNMGLDDDQEEWVCEKVEVASKSIYGCVQENVSQERLLTQIVALLERLTNDQNRLLEETLTVPVLPVDDMSDIELF